jgi:hypothetical protein
MWHDGTTPVQGLGRRGAALETITTSLLYKDAISSVMGKYILMRFSLKTNSNKFFKKTFTYSSNPTFLLNWGSHLCWIKRIGSLIKHVIAYFYLSFHKKKNCLLLWGWCHSMKNRLLPLYYNLKVPSKAPCLKMLTSSHHVPAQVSRILAGRCNSFGLLHLTSLSLKIIKISSMIIC